MQGFMINRCSQKKRGINPSTTVGAQKKERVENGVSDKLSQLPEEILLAILSLLPIKEAARTSVLSHRWRKNWTFIPNLHFDALDALRSVIRLTEPLRIQAKQKYIDWVNSVLNSYQATTVVEFRVLFDLDADNSRDIESWVKFAFEKKVESLTMHFPMYVNSFRGLNHYPFPALSNSSKLLSDYASLRKLDLEFVDISWDFIQHLISSCPLLEELAIVASHSQHLVHVNIDDGPSPICLKHLKIAKCSYVKSIYLSASNLSSFEYQGEVIDINWAHIPNLVDVFLGGKYFNDYIIYNFPRLSNYVMRLETLALAARGIEIQNTMLVVFPELPSLRNLKLDVYATDDESILHFASLIKAAPSLHKLELQLFWHSSMYWCKRRVEKISKCPHQCLKEVEILGFLGRTVDREFVMYVLENAVALEKVTLDHLSPQEKAHGSVCSLKRLERAMKHAKRLKSKFSLGKKLVIL